jgi:cyclic pyranopterin phosphate synthase
VRLLARVGVRRVRLTGGEPTVRRGLTEFVAELARIGLEDLALSTNGHYLPELAEPLRAAGLQRLNISVDTLDPHKFRHITRRGDLGRVIAGIEAARAVGFTGTKLNTVAVAGFNDHEIPTLAAWAWERGLVPRFIEWMPMSDGALFAPGGFFPAAAIRARLESAFGRLVSDEASDLPGVGPARYQRVEGTSHRVGIISAVTEQFCDTCNRVRLSATGQLHACLASDQALDLRTPLRTGLPDDELLERVRAGVAIKVRGHSFTPEGCGGPKKHMVAIGG